MRRRSTATSSKKKSAANIQTRMFQSKPPGLENAAAMKSSDAAKIVRRARTERPKYGSGGAKSPQSSARKNSSTLSQLLGLGVA